MNLTHRLLLKKNVTKLNVKAINHILLNGSGRVADTEEEEVWDDVVEVVGFCVVDVIGFEVGDVVGFDVVVGGAFCTVTTTVSDAEFPDPSYNVITTLCVPGDKVSTLY